jgi:two-component system sensor histidine kinase CpxA
MAVKPRFPLVGKILLLAALNLVLVGAILSVYIDFQLRQEFESFLMATARDRIMAVAQLLYYELQGTPPEHRSPVLARYSSAYSVEFYLFDAEGKELAGQKVSLPEEVARRLTRGRGGRPLERAGTEPPPSLEASLEHGHLPPFPPFLVTAQHRFHYWVGVRMPFREGGESIHFTTLLIASPSLLDNPFFFQWRPWAGIALITLAVSLLCWLPLIRGLTHSVGQAMKATARIAEGDFNVQVPTNRRDELGHLGASINRMASRLESLVRGQKRFLGDAAHELRSPLGRMRVALELLERRASPEEAGYVSDLQEEVERMVQLTDELLAYAKADLRPEPAQLQPTLVHETVARVVQLEATPETDIRVQVPTSLRVKVEPEFLFRSISNLVRNAIRYAGQAGPITVAAAPRGDMVEITVADSGPGVPEEALEKVFTPFFRLEASRNPRTGGIGLGLAIVRSCIEACHGSVECRNRQPSGFEVILTLPAV